MNGAIEIPAALHNELSALLSPKLFNAFASGPDDVNVLVMRGSKKTANDRIVARDMSRRWKKRFHVQEVGFEPTM